MFFGPHNAPYKNLKSHLEISNLTKIAYLSNLKSKPFSEEYEEDKSTQIWSRICDITTCLDMPVLVNSPTGYAIDAAGSLSDTIIHRLLPKPPEVCRFTLTILFHLILLLLLLLLLLLFDCYNCYY